MRLISRSVLREIWPPFLLGFAAYTFILLIRTILFLADFAVRRSASVLEVARLVVLSLPWIVVLTMPMAFLLGVLIGVGRLSADSELVALRACGMGPRSAARPALAGAARPLPGRLRVYNVRAAGHQCVPRDVDGPGRRHLHRQRRRAADVPRAAARASPSSSIALAPDGRSFEGVFLKLGDEGEPPNRDHRGPPGRSRRSRETGCGSTSSGSTVHEIDPEDPARYRTSRNATQRLLLAGEGVNDPGTRVVSAERLPGTVAAGAVGGGAAAAPLRSPPPRRPGRDEQEARDPVRVLRFRAGRRAARAGRFAGAAGAAASRFRSESSSATTCFSRAARPGRSRAGSLRAWRCGCPILRSWCSESPPRSSGRTPGSSGPAPSRRSGRGRAGAFGPPDAGRDPLPRLRLRLLSLVDRYVLARFLTALALVLASAILISLVVDYADKLDEVARHHPSAAAVLGYYRYFLLSITIQIAPFAVLLAALAGLGILSKNNEDTAFRASGVSLLRLGVPVFVAAAAAAPCSASRSASTSCPSRSSRQARYKNEIYGLPADTGVRDQGEHNWYLSDRGEIWHREETEPHEHPALRSLHLPLRHRPSSWSAARRRSEAVLDRQDWRLSHGWTRDFAAGAGEPYRAFTEETIPGDPPARARGRPPQARGDAFPRARAADATAARRRLCRPPASRRRSSRSWRSPPCSR